ncbi:MULTISPECIES: RadC family protein [unclassified Lentimonas]|uniref:JAB domain-containing protein n=1 Tax=unclassified Lentimonas TaxID=2630993 RepID=UPI001323E6E1|nr:MULTISPECIES: JAB domain-containing protein [unclassified Lentimonas]CAA6692619.1 DNA repair protein RadC [Lentimonas sp. CC19]CAA6696968.1 DNA repair protein RadC [Lentimonas sp. CC10]CAA7070995.1 DNA repair protein RadC [Lentimonas sp. CC11]
MRIFEASLQYRLVREGKVEPLDTPEKLAEYVRDGFFDPSVEFFMVVPVNSQNMPFGRVIVSRGTATSCLVNPREVLRPCILCNATAFAVSHNHPSGVSQPSRADIQVTRQLREAGQSMGINLIDHVILGDPGMPIYSFNEAGLI